MNEMHDREGKIERLLARNVEKIIERSHLEKALRSGKKLRIKLGIDPTAPDLHLGHAVILRKLKEFQDLGHKIVLIIGDFTGRIGDPSGRTEARVPLTEKDVKRNMKEYLAQADTILSIKKAEIRHNSEWLAKEGAETVLKLAGAGSIQQMLRRADFKKRLDAGGDVSMLEALYPLFQGYDSVAVRADVEIGGTDQTFNLLMGRKVQRHFGMKEQDIIMLPLLVGTDGAKKMSKSAGNYVGLNESPDEMFGKIMSIPDGLMESYFLLCTDLEEKEIKKLERELKPRDLKARLGFEIAKLYHGEKKAHVAEEKFAKIFSGKEVPASAPAHAFARKSISVLGTTMMLGVVSSKSEARRLIIQGGFRVNDIAKKNPNEILILHSGDTLKIGKHRFFRVK